MMIHLILILIFVQHTIVPSTLQLSAMATQMLVISPVLSLVSALVIPSMALSVGCLGERLRSLFNKANISTASLSAYLNEVFPSILFVRANNAEANERIRFQSLASADLSACLKKKQMKDSTNNVYWGSVRVWCHLTGGFKSLTQLLCHSVFLDIIDSVDRTNSAVLKYLSEK